MSLDQPKQNGEPENAGQQDNLSLQEKLDALRNQPNLAEIQQEKLDQVKINTPPFVEFNVELKADVFDSSLSVLYGGECDGDCLIVLVQQGSDAILAREYLALKGVTNCKVIAAANPLKLLSLSEYKNKSVLVISNFSQNPDLKNTMFDTSRQQQFSLINSTYVSGNGGVVIGANSRLLETMGGVLKLAKNNISNQENSNQEISENSSKKDIISNPNIPLVIHALGPWGTNISQDAKREAELCRKDVQIIQLKKGQQDISKIREIIEKAGKKSKSIVLVYNGIEPHVYSNIAAELADQPNNKEIHSAVMCAVYYKEREMHDFYNDRGGDFLHYISISPLDGMTLVKRKGATIPEKPIFASHPSPKTLTDSFVNGLNGGWTAATSNSAAGELVLSGKADFAIVTADVLRKDAESGNPQFEIVKEFGQSPFMAFNYAVANTQNQVNNIFTHNNS